MVTSEWNVPECIHLYRVYLERLRLKPEPFGSLLGKIGLGAVSGGCHRSISSGVAEGDCADAAELFTGPLEDLPLPPDGLVGRLDGLHDVKNQ